jgi:uncharacterized protein
MDKSTAVRRGERAFQRLERTATRQAAEGGTVTDAVAKKVIGMARRGSPSANYALATWYLFGHKGAKIEIKKDISRAVKLLKLAARGGVANALYDLAVCYEIGAGVEKSEYEAFRGYMKAALLGDADATYEVGRLYYHGIGVSKDRALAKAWLDRAHELGHS